MRREIVDGRYYFDEESAQRAVDFFEKYLVHVKGRFAGKPFILEDWQRDDIIRPLFGWKNLDGTRRYRTAYIEIPRKNGKSTLCAGIALYLLCADGEYGAEVYSAAANKAQASIVFGVAKSMALASPALRKRLDPFKLSLVYAGKDSKYEVLSKETLSQTGLNASGVIFDELHAQKDRELWEVLTTSVGGRDQPLVVAITTAGKSMLTICGEMHKKALRVIADPSSDPTFFAKVYAASPKSDWKDPRTWTIANPGLGVTVKLSYFEDAVRDIADRPTGLDAFLRFHLNVWTKGEVRWLEQGKWDACGALAPRTEDLRKMPCYAGLDLASTTDLAALALIWADQATRSFFVRTWYWVPEEGIERRSRIDSVPYEHWRDEGFINATPGNVIDYDAIERKLDELDKIFRIQEIGYDPYGAVQIVQRLETKGHNLVPVRQGFLSMSPPMKELETHILTKRIHHDGNPVLAWNFENAVAEVDAAGNVKPSKKLSTERIDGAVATIIGFDRAVRADAFSSWKAV